MASDLDLYHPALRDMRRMQLSLASSWVGQFFLPETDRIAWYGDCRLYCTPAQYQDVLDSVPGAPLVGEGLYRRTSPSFGGKALDD